MSLAPLPDYAPVCVHDQVVEVRKQLAIVRCVTDRKVAAGKLAPAAAAVELQTLQSAVRTLEAVEQAIGPTAIVRGPDDLGQGAT